MKIVLITGVDKGIGHALMETFLAEGYFVIGTFFSDRPEAHEHLKDFALDLGKPESIASCVSAITNFGKNIDILINNAGILADEDETQIVVEKLRKTLEVNLIGTIDFTQRLLPLMSEGAHIVNISSTAGSLELVGKVSHFMGHYPAYKISKAALNMYTRTLALELKDREITVSSVHPGWTKTDMGGEEAELTPTQAADGIYKTAVSHPESGGFWFAGERLPW
ncbi:MAG TPA: SDR family NAD(P)-dependent oxidoreductase [Patescibacteria group bacterium]|nr:SDR family NAD(P)-dependent oxidoreductase [Patescibacteria group bacterium]